MGLGLLGFSQGRGGIIFVKTGYKLTCCWQELHSSRSRRYQNPGSILSASVECDVSRRAASGRLLGRGVEEDGLSLTRGGGARGRRGRAKEVEEGLSEEVERIRGRLEEAMRGGVSSKGSSKVAAE